MEKDLDKMLKKYKAQSIITSIILIVFSIVLIAHPEESLKVFMIIAGILFIALGLFSIYSYFKNTIKSIFDMGLITGIVEISVGIITLASPEQVVELIYIVTGIWIIFENVIKIQLALNFRDNLGFSRATIILSILDIILGIFIITHPGLTGSAVIMLTGISLLISEVYSLAQMIYFSIKFKD